MTTPSTIQHLVFFALVVLIGACATSAAVADGDATNSAGELWLERSAGANGADEPDSPYAQLAREVGPAVVNVLVAYAGDRPPHARRSIPGPHPEGFAEGSGFVIHPDGFVLTNFHVIEAADTVTVKFEDGREYNAHIIGADPLTDIALMEVDADEPLPSVTLGDSSDIHVGDYVVAIGNPLGLSHSMTAGIISALDRRDLPIEGQEHQGNFIQIDAPINPGNSGGPLIDMSGDVIGINAAINRQGQGISFAIPINLVKTLLPQLQERGYVIRSWLGVRVQPMDPFLARSFELSDSRGALVTEVVSDSPAARAGIETRDVIVGVEGVTVRDSDDLPLMISTAPSDATVTLDVVRAAESISVDVELESQPDQAAPELPGRDRERPSDFDDEYYGIGVEEMTETYATDLDAPADRGVIVTELPEASPAHEAGLQADDVILQVDMTDITSEGDFHSALDDADGDVIRLKVLRSGRSVYVAFPR